MTQPPESGPEPERPEEPAPGDQSHPQQPQGQGQYGQPSQGQYGQQSYGQYGQQPYGAPQYSGQYTAPPSHPQATTVLVLGIVSLVACQVLGPFAWVMGNKAVREIDASGGQYGGRDQAQIGRILGIIGTVLLALGLLFLVLMLVGMFVFGTATYTSTY